MSLCRSWESSRRSRSGIGWATSHPMTAPTSWSHLRTSGPSKPRATLLAWRSSTWRSSLTNIFESGNSDPRPAHPRWCRCHLPHRGGPAPSTRQVLLPDSWGRELGRRRIATALVARLARAEHPDRKVMVVTHEVPIILTATSSSDSMWAAALELSAAGRLPTALSPPASATVPDDCASSETWTVPLEVQTDAGHGRIRYTCRLPLRRPSTSWRCGRDRCPPTSTTTNATVGPCS